MANKISNLAREVFHSMSERNFRIYNAGMFVSNIGTWMQGVALSWLVYRLTGSASSLGLVAFANSMPLLLLTFFGGLAADRFDKRKILFVTQTVAMLQAVALAVMVAMDLITMEIVIGLACVLGIVTAFEVPTRQAFVPSLIKDSKYLPNAIGLSSATFHVSRMIGPALGGVLIASAGESICFVLNVISFLGAFVALAKLKIERPDKTKTDRETGSDRTGMAQSQWQSVKALIKRPGVFTLLILAAFVSTFGMQYSILMPVIADKLLGGQSMQYGFLSASGGLGALLGALTIAAIGRKSGMRKRLGWACLGLVGGIIVVASSQHLMLSVVAIAVCGACLSLHWSGGNALMQQCAEPSARGKLSGIYTTFTLGLAPFTGLLAGWTAEHLGVSMALYLSGACLLIGVIVYLYLVRRLDDLC